MTERQDYAFPYHTAHRRRDMEKQLHVFQRLENCSTIWPRLPEENRQKIERIFAELIIKHLSSLFEEIKDHDK
jgi:hypothetical protein